MKSAHVSFQDIKSIRHEIEVEASSLNEAIVKAVCELRSNGYFIEDDVEIRVIVDGESYSRTVNQVRRSLGKNPNPGNKELVAMLHRSRFGG